MTTVVLGAPPLAEQVFITWENLRWIWRDGSHFVGVHHKKSFGYEADVGGGISLHFFCDYGSRFLDGEGRAALIPVPITSYVVRLVWDGKIIQGVSYSEFRDMPFVPSFRLFEGASQLKEIFNKIRLTRVIK